MHTKYFYYISKHVWLYYKTAIYHTVNVAAGFYLAFRLMKPLRWHHLMVRHDYILLPPILAFMLHMCLYFSTLIKNIYTSISNGTYLTESNTFAILWWETESMEDTSCIPQDVMCVGFHKAECQVKSLWDVTNIIHKHAFFLLYHRHILPSTPALWNVQVIFHNLYSTENAAFWVWNSL